MTETPFEVIKKKISNNISKKSAELLPKKWEKIGEVLIIKLPKTLEKHQDKIGEIYADILKCKTVLKDKEGIKGEYREPDVEIIYGSKNTETIHHENGIRYKLNPKKIMFSSGNMDERIRMSSISNSDETVVDLFAGIGYFTLPIAVYGTVKKVFACEKNPVAFDYLCQNISLNNVNSIVEPIEGDNRCVAPENIADRVVMGYFDGTIDFLETALNCLKNRKGIIHFHKKYPNKEVPEKTMKDINKIVEGFHRKAELIEFNQVKSFAPGIGHYVFDIKIR